MPLNPERSFHQNVKTNRDLLAQLLDMSDEQLDCNLAIQLLSTNEVFSSATEDFRFDFAGSNHQTLDENHPIFVLNI